MTSRFQVLMWSCQSEPLSWFKRLPVVLLIFSSAFYDSHLNRTTLRNLWTSIKPYKWKRQIINHLISCKTHSKHSESDLFNKLSRLMFMFTIWCVQNLRSSPFLSHHMKLESPVSRELVLIIYFFIALKNDWTLDMESNHSSTFILVC